MKWLGLETDHSPPSSTKVKNEWSYAATHPHAIMACIGTAYIHSVYLTTGSQPL